MSDPTLDILMITHARPAYTARALGQLLSTCSDRARVWIWQNGPDTATRAVVESMSTHPRVHRVHFSETNERLWAPTAWLWRESEGEYVGKVDDDCLVPDLWCDTLATAHGANPMFGVLGCSLLRDEDIEPDLVEPRLQSFAGGHTLMRHCWVAGSGYIMKRACITRHGVLRQDESFTAYCIRLATHGWVNGYYYPFLYQEHMDDPRSPYCEYRTDAAFARARPLTAQVHDARTLGEWTRLVRRHARSIQEAPLDPRAYAGWRWRLRRAKQRWAQMRDRLLAHA